MRNADETGCLPYDPREAPLDKMKILIIDDERAARYGMRKALESQGYEVAEAEDGESGLRQVEWFAPDLVICDISMPGMDGMTFLRRIGDADDPPPVIMITAYGSERVAVDAMKEGAYEYISKPYEVDELRLVVRNALEKVRLERENRALRFEVARRGGFGEIVGESPVMEKVYDLISKVSPTDVTVLVQGESGTGKELVARAIHEGSARKDGPFVSMNCAALPRDLIESELFGHEQGAFTGASKDRPGKFELAHGGTLFLDEIGDMSLDTQAKVLRVLQERTFERLGGSKSIEVDVRVISATNKDLPQEIAEGRFREDLYYRVKVVEVLLPPLRERREDIPLLAQHILRRFNERHGRSVEGISPEAMHVLMEYDWPGNVRQLMNVLERAVILTQGDVLESTHLSMDQAESRFEVSEEVEQSGVPEPYGRGEDLSFQEAKREAVRSFEIDFLSAALKEHRGNVTRTASQLGMKRQSLQQKLKELGLDAAGFR